MLVAMKGPYLRVLSIRIQLVRVFVRVLNYVLSHGTHVEGQ